MDIAAKIDELLEKPCYLIDIFPCTVPPTPDGRYFMVEEYFQKNRAEWDGKFCNLLLKLYCYCDFWVSAGAELVQNPEPARLAGWIRRCFAGDRRTRDGLCIILPDCDAMIVLNGDDLYLTLCHPDRRLLDLITQLAGAEGLFVYRASEGQKQDENDSLKD